MIKRHPERAADDVEQALATELGGELLAHSESIRPVEVQYLVGQLEKKNFLEARQEADNETEHTVTIDGYAYLAELRKKAVDSQRAFIAMWFDETLLAAWEKGIEPGIRDAGYEPVRIDRKDHNNKIDDEIVAEIRRAHFLVADFTQGDTGARGGVYYEAGFAHGLNIPVIFTCREDAVDSLQFDTRQYNHITWKTPEELRERLTKRVSATIGDGPLAKPNSPRPIPHTGIARASEAVHGPLLRAEVTSRAVERPLNARE